MTAGDKRQLLEAAKRGDEPSLNHLLLNGYSNVNEKDDKGRGALWWAIHHGFETIVDLLLRQSALNPNRRCSDGYSPLSKALSTYNNKQYIMVGLLLGRQDLLVDGEDLFELAFSKESDLTKLLADSNRAGRYLSVDFKEEENGDISIVEEEVSKLAWAAQNGFSDIVKAEVARDPDQCNLEDNQGRTPLVLALGDRSNIKVVRELVKVPGVTTYRNSLGETPLVAADKAGKRDVVELLRGMGDGGLSQQVQSTNSAGERLDHHSSSRAAARGRQRFERWLKGLAYLGVRDPARRYQATELGDQAGYRRLHSRSFSR